MFLCRFIYPSLEIELFFFFHHQHTSITAEGCECAPNYLKKLSGGTSHK